MHCDHPPLQEFPRATKQQAVALLTASTVNPGGVSFCSRLLCLLQGSSFSFRSFPCQDTLSTRAWCREVNWPLQRVQCMLHRQQPPSLQHLLSPCWMGIGHTWQCCTALWGSQKARGQGHNRGSVIFRGADKSRGGKPQQPVAAKIREGTQPVGCAAAACAELLGSCTGSDHRGEHGQHGHMHLPAKSALPACLHPSKSLGIW